MRITLVQPCMGREAGRSYLRSWQMEPLTLAVLASLTPRDVEVRLVDDRIEPVPFDAPTDLVAMTVETYTARRAYQIASDFRSRGVPVVMGGFHPTLCPGEAGEHAESVVLGEAESVWPRVVDDYRHGTAEKFYRADDRTRPGGSRPRRFLFRGRRYVPVGLVEGGRGCRYRCDFCAVGAFHEGCLSWRPADEIALEMAEVARERKLVFLVDDNVGADPSRAKDLFRALAPMGVRWVGQCGIHAARDEDLLDLMARSGCQGVLVGFESLSRPVLHAMNKTFARDADYDAPLRNLARHGIAVFGTFVFGYDDDPPDAFRRAVEFAVDQRLYLAAFNHLVPFPGTPLYRRLEEQGRLLFRRWWLDERYRFNDVAFRPASLTAEELRSRCMDARRRFYSLSSIGRRALGRASLGRAFLFRNYLPLNLLHRMDVGRRDGHPLGDRSWQGTLLRSEAPRLLRATTRAAASASS